MYNKPVHRILAILLLIPTLCYGASPVQLKSRSGYMASVGARLRFAISIERNSKNRSFCLQWASVRSTGQSCDTLEGEKAPITHWREITFRRSGDYNVIVVLQQNDDTLVSNIETIRITGPFDDE
jgi:hypothetical protein